ncbi:MAG: hypothetical protein DRI57_00165 [Deltaproteobacteria bacterium]|nr:MAG: hypothetical protein DRI57_00165 [Deltaproteobacteria bacterium]
MELDILVVVVELVILDILVELVKLLLLETLYLIFQKLMLLTIMMTRYGNGIFDTIWNHIL